MPGEIDWRAVAAEFIGCTLFLFITIGGCGWPRVLRPGRRTSHASDALCGCLGAVEQALAGTGNWTLSVALTFGMTITVLAYTVGHYSGAHINGAVTFGLVIAGQTPVVQGLLNFAAQLLGSITGVGLLALMTPCSKDLTGGMGSNSVADGYEFHQALVGEIICVRGLLVCTSLLNAFTKLPCPCRRFSLCTSCLRRPSMSKARPTACSRRWRLAWQSSLPTRS